MPPAHYFKKVLSLNDVLKLNTAIVENQCAWLLRAGNNGCNMEFETVL